MYTNIKTDPALAEISSYIMSDTVSWNPRKKLAMLDALHLVFKNNIFKFGDTYWRQRSGTAMGTPPAPPWATLFFAPHEDRLCEKYSHCLWLYRRFIEDVFGVWLVDEDPQQNKQNWTDFCTDLNAWYGLEWKSTTPSNTYNFMDLTISIVNNRIHTTLYEKEMNLYLYIPPHSSHPKGVFTGLIFGQVLRIRRLCSTPSDATKKIQEFFNRLVARGHSPDALMPLFQHAHKNASVYLSQTDEDRDLARRHKLVNSKNKSFSTSNTILRILICKRYNNTALFSKRILTRKRPTSRQPTLFYLRTFLSYD